MFAGFSENLHGTLASGRQNHSCPGSHSGPGAQFLCFTVGTSKKICSEISCDSELFTDERQCGH
jgi:hypothetical protein